MSDHNINVITKFGLPVVPLCKQYINGVYTPEMIVVARCDEKLPIDDGQKNLLRDTISYYKELFTAFEKINLSKITLEDAEALMEYFPFVFNNLFLVQRGYYFKNDICRVTIVDDKNIRVRDSERLSFPPLTLVQEKKKFNRCNTFHTTLFYASFFENVAVAEMRPKKGDNIIITHWRNNFPDKLYYFGEIPNADVNNLTTIKAKEAYRKALEGKEQLFQELINLVTSFIASQFVKEIVGNEEELSKNRLEYLFSAYVSRRLLNPPPQNGPLKPSDLLMYPSVPSKHVHENIAMKPEILSDFTLVKATEYLVEETFYNKVDLGDNEMPVTLSELRYACDYKNNKIVWSDDK